MEFRKKEIIHKNASRERHVAVTYGAGRSNQKVVKFWRREKTRLKLSMEFKSI